MESQSKKIIKQYKDSCNELAGLVNMQLFDGCRKWYWIGGEVGGASFTIGSESAIVKEFKELTKYHDAFKNILNKLKQL